eukprot:scaffold5754_cov166-Amphora_coffeaeformis.AAC.3
MEYFDVLRLHKRIDPIIKEIRDRRRFKDIKKFFREKKSQSETEMPGTLNTVSELQEKVEKTCFRPFQRLPCASSTRAQIGTQIGIQIERR